MAVFLNQNVTVHLFPVRKVVFFPDAPNNLYGSLSENFTLAQNPAVQTVYCAESQPVLVVFVCQLSLLCCPSETRQESNTITSHSKNTQAFS